MSAAPFPMLLDLAARPVLVAGGGRVATRKVRRLLEAEAAVRVVSPEVTEELSALAAADRLRWEARPAVEADLDGAWLAFLATSDATVNARLEAAAAARGVLVNRADRPGGGDFQVPAATTRGDLRVMISTAGASPALARVVRQRVERLLEEEFGGVLEHLVAVRRSLRQQGLDETQRQRFWARFPDDQAMDALRAGSAEEIGREVERCVSSLSA